MFDKTICMNKNKVDLTYQKTLDERETFSKKFVKRDIK
jgi:hypothetical protein